MVALRLDRRLQGRVDPSDVIQEAYLQAARRLPEYLRELKPMPVFLWLRFLAAQSLQSVHRKHLGVMARDAGREISIHAGRMPQATSAALAAQLLGHDTRASEAAIRAERKLRLEQALNHMDPLDREVLALRHFEQLSNSECARVLGLKDTTATKRYVRAEEAERASRIASWLEFRSRETTVSSHDSQSGGDPLGGILESFLARLRRGERPSLKEYADRYPELAEDICDLLPAMVELEHQGPTAGACPQSVKPGEASARTASDVPAHGTGDSPLPAPASHSIPDRLGDYRIIRPIGGGGMGMVYEAERSRSEAGLRSR